MNTPYHYWAYGLCIESEIEMPELLPYTFTHPDVRVSLGKIDPLLPEQFQSDKIGISFLDEGFLYRATGTARYLVSGGDRVVIDAIDGAEPRAIRLYFLSNAMSAILHQRGQVPFHASAVHTGDGLALFCGRSGAGKSTTALHLSANGYPMFSDDACVLSVTPEGQVQAYAAYPGAKLWDDAYGKLGMERPGEQQQILSEMKKFSHHFHDQFTTSPCVVKRIFVLEKNDDQEQICLSPLAALAAFRALEYNAYRPLQTNMMQKRDVFFKMLSALVNGCEIYQLVRPTTANSVEDVARILREKLPAIS